LDYLRIMDIKAIDVKKKLGLKGVDNLLSLQLVVKFF